MSEPLDQPKPTHPAPPSATASSAPMAGSAYTAPPAGSAGPGDDWRPQALAIMTLVGAGVAFLFAIINLFAAFAVCVTLITAAYSLAVGIVCLINGLNLLNKPLDQQRPPYPSAIMQVINIVSCDVVNLGLGIAILVFLNDPQVRSKFLP
jgi:hypothetical protein